MDYNGQYYQIGGLEIKNASYCLVVFHISFFSIVAGIMVTMHVTICSTRNQMR